MLGFMWFSTALQQTRQTRGSMQCSSTAWALVLVLVLLLQQCTAQLCSSASGTCSAPPDYGCNPSNGGKCCKTANAWTNCPLCPAGAPTPSSLYGCSGELWDKGTGRLLDWSYAGYMYGDYNPPSQPPWLANIKTAFGARGDGVTDDTAAFELAIQTIPFIQAGIILVPAGTYVITRRLDIDKRIFFQGEGSSKTRLYFPKSLQEIYGNSYTGGVSQYAFGPGFINFNGGDYITSDTLLATVTANAYKGQSQLQVDSVNNIAPGSLVRLVMDNTGGELLSDLNQGMFPPFAKYTDRQDIIRWTSRVKSVSQSSNSVVLERTLPFAVNTAWNPQVHLWVTDLYGVKRNTTGAADLTIRFPGDNPYPGETKEYGYNGLYFYAAAHSWVKNVVFENAELGVAFDTCSFNTVDNVTFTSVRPTTNTKYTGSYGIWLKNTMDHVVSGFNFKTNMRYEIALMYFAIGNVISSGKGVDLTLELQYGASYGNLFTNIHLGAATEPFGWVVRGQDGSGYNTFWNLRTDSDTLALPPGTWAPRPTFVNAEKAAMPANAATVDWLLETRTDVWPLDLWNSMRARRGRPLKAPQPTRYSGPGYGCTLDGKKCCWTGDSSCPLCPSSAVNPSALWGCGGELWNPKGRLVYDWGFAGHNGGSVPPLLPVKVNLKTDFGAKGDGYTDDTQALVSALDSITGGVIYMPAGVYIITAVINIRKAIVLRGDGEGKTILKFPKSLTELYGNTWTEGTRAGVSQYSHGTGFINMGGWDPAGKDFTRITPIKQGAARGERVLKVWDTSNITVGQWVRIMQKDPGDGSLMYELNGNAMPITDAQKGYPDPCRFLTRVQAKGPDWIRIERVVPFKLDLRWSPEVHKFMPMINDNVGYEYFTLEFPQTTYPGHFLEQGYNGLHMNQIANGWVRSVTVLNGDMAVYLWGCVFTSIDSVTVASKPSRGYFGGHRGVWMEHGSDTLVKNFHMSDRFVHDFSVSNTEHGTVVFNSAGLDMNLDHHKMSPYENLFSNLDIGIGTRVFEGAGDATFGAHSAFYTCFHNLQGAIRTPLPDPSFGPNLTFIGLSTDDPTDPTNLGWYVEKLAKSYPPDFYTQFRKSRGWRNPSS